MNKIAVNLKWTLILPLALSLLTFPPTQVASADLLEKSPSQEQDLIGHWIHDTGERNVELIFTDEGTMVLDGKVWSYAVEGNQLKVQTGSVAVQYTYKFDGDTLTISGGNISGEMIFHSVVEVDPFADLQKEVFKEKQQPDKPVIDESVEIRSNETTRLKEQLQPIDSEPQSEARSFTDMGGIEYVLIPAGEFYMGAGSEDLFARGDEGPLHRVSIRRDFWMSETEVTVGAYRKFAEAGGRDMPEAPDFNLEWRDDSQPIVSVSWRDAVAYCEWAGVRLPTEAEWEYAARGGIEGANYVWGDKSFPVVNGVKQANTGDESLRQVDKNARYFPAYDDGFAVVAPTASFAPNDFGLFDMGGNIWEWCGDWYDKSYYSNSPAVNPPGPPSGKYRILRGGSWRNGPANSRVSFRYIGRPHYKNTYTGFRCVRDETP